MKQIRPPSFLENLLRDLRDRRLVLPAIALLVGLFAVPMLLKSQASTTGAPAAPVEGSGAGDDQAVPAVVSQQVGVTNYRKRLSQLQSKNPFHQQYAGTPDSAELHITSTGTASSSTSATAATGTTGTGATTSTSSVVSGITSSGGTSTASSPPLQTSGGGSDSAVPTHHTKSRLHFYAWRVSVKVGEPGHLKERPEVQRLRMLPTEGKPVVTFIGASEDGDRALFLVSPDVDSVKGEGRCLPSHSACQYVAMKAGEKASFHYAPNGNRYNLVLVDVHAVDATEKLPKKPSGNAQPQQNLPLLGDG
jgi:hypothetical protein